MPFLLPPEVISGIQKSFDYTPILNSSHEPLFLFDKNKLLARLVLNKEVFIKCYGAGQNNRILAVVYVDRKNVNLKLIKGDLSEVHLGGDPPEAD